MKICKNSFLFLVCCFSFLIPPPAFAMKTSIYPDKVLTEQSKAFVKQASSHLNNLGTAKFEELYQSDPRQIGELIVTLSVINWTDPSAANFERLNNWVVRAIQTEQWGNNHDLEISHLLFGLSIAYDWYSEKWDASLKTLVRGFVLKHTQELYDYGVTQKGYWGSSYWHNHCWINFSALLAVSRAFSDFEQAKNWADVAEDRLKKSLVLQDPEGANHEGLNYSVYGTIWLLRGLSMMENGGSAIFQTSGYLKNYSEYFLAMAVNDKLDTFFDVGDSPRYLWYNPAEIFLKLYQEYQEPKDLALYHHYVDSYRELPPTVFAAVYGIPTEKSKMATAWDFSKPQWFKDLGLFTHKDFKNGAVSGAFLFKSGLPGGRMAYETIAKDAEAKLNISHSHPDQNGFVIWTPKGFLMADTGNSFIKKTEDHNTLTVNAAGQFGEGERWLKEEPYLAKSFGPNAGLQEFKSEPGYFMLTAEARDFYPDQLGIEIFHRDIVYLEGMGYLIIDKIKQKTPQNFELHFHSEFNFAENYPGYYTLLKGKEKAGSFFVLYPGAFSVSIKEKVPDPKANKRKTTPLHVLSLGPQAPASEVLFVSFIGLHSFNAKPDVLFQDTDMAIQIKQELKECQIHFPVSGELRVGLKCTEYTKKKANKTKNKTPKANP